MSLKELSNSELEALFNLTEIYLDRIRTNIKININNDKLYAELNELFRKVDTKLSLIVEEIRTRIDSIKE